MNFERLIVGLRGAGYDPAATELLDAFWLATCMIGRKTETPVAQTGAEQEKELSPIAEETPAGHAEPDRRSTGTNGSAATATRDEPDEQLTTIFPQGWSTPETSTRNASSFAVPAANALPDQLALMRALKPFARRYPSGRDREIDEELTVDLSAASGRRGLILPAFRPRPERWFDADIVIEDDLALQIWRETLLKLRLLTAASGAFRDVRLWQLYRVPGTTKDAPLRDMLERVVVAGGMAARIPAEALTADGRRRLVLFATHGASEFWRDGRYAEILATWRRQASLALLHLLPTHRWPFTALGESPAQVRAQAPGLKAAELDYQTFWWLAPPDDPKTYLAVPGVSLDAPAIARWARMQMGAAVRAEAFLIARTGGEAADREDDTSTATADLRQAPRAIAMLRDHSPEAFRLAVHLAPSSFTLPVARLVQEALFGDKARPEQLGELFLSGLIAPVAEGSEPIEQRYFSVTEASRGFLLGSLSLAGRRDLAAAIEAQVSRLIAGKVATDVVFTGLVRDLHGPEKLPAWAEPFARAVTAFRRAPAQFTLPETTSAPAEFAEKTEAPEASLSGTSEAEVETSPGPESAEDASPQLGRVSAKAALIFDNRPALGSRAGFHAVFIGVSDYRYLEEADDPPGLGGRSLRKLRSSAATAMALARKFQELEADGRLLRPLATIRLLVSPSADEIAADPALGAFDLLPATMANIEWVLHDWRSDVASQRDNQSLFLFSGHAVRRSLEESILLAADFLAPRAAEMSRSFRLSNVRHGMGPSSKMTEIGREQFYFVDGCLDPGDVLDSRGSIDPPNIFDVDLNTLDDRKAPIVFSKNLGGASSAGMTGTPTYFGLALLSAIENGSFGEENVPGIQGRVWPVTASSLKAGMDASDALLIAKVEIVGLVSNPILCFSRSPPELPLARLLAVLPESPENLTIENLATNAKFSFPDKAGNWPDEMMMIPAGNYKITIDRGSGQIWTRIHNFSILSAGTRYSYELSEETPQTSEPPRNAPSEQRDPLPEPRIAPQLLSPRMRIYRHGYGDSILVNLSGPSEPYPILVNCGLLTGTPNRLERLRRVVDDIGAATGNRLRELIITQTRAHSLNGISAVADRGMLDEAMLSLGWWDNPSDAQAAAYRNRRREVRSPPNEKSLAVARERCQRTRYVEPGERRALGETGASLVILGASRNPALLPRDPPVPSMDFAIETASGSVLLFLGGHPLPPTWKAFSALSLDDEDGPETGRDLLASAIICSVSPGWITDQFFETSVLPNLPYLQYLSVQADDDSMAQRRWKPPQLEFIDALLRDRGGGVLRPDSDFTGEAGVEVTDNYFDISIDR